MESIISFISSGVSYVGPFILLMGTLIFIHEMGHFLVAKYFGVRVEVFSLGFGKSLYQFTRGDTTYKLSMIPLGGYVKMFGDDPTAELVAEDKQFSFLYKPVWQRIAIVLAGPLMNFIIAIPIFALILALGYKAPANFIGDIKSDTQAYKVGFRSGDKILKINDRPVFNWIDVDKIISSNANKTLSFKVLSQAGAEQSISVDIPQVENDKLFGLEKHIGKIDGLTLISKSSLIGVRNGSIAASSGLKSLDQILKINGDDVSYQREIEPLLQKHKDSKIEFTVRLFNQHTKNPERTVVLKSAYPINGQSISESIGIESTAQYVSGVVPDSPAELAGLVAGDKILSIDKTPISGWKDILKTIKSYDESKGSLTIEVQNSDPKYGRNLSSKTLSLTPKMTKLMNNKMQDEKRFTVGIYADNTIGQNKLVDVQSNNPIKALSYGFNETIKMTKLIALGIYKLITNQVSTRNLSGMITIGKIAGDSYKAGWDSFLRIMGLLSVNLFLLNLLPIPVLDGGHLLFFTIEAIKGSPISLKKMQIAQQFGFIILLSLMVFSHYNDILNLINPPW